MAKQGIITTAQDVITDAARTGVSSVSTLAGDVAGAARKAATGAILRTVKRARAAVNSDLPRRKKARNKTTRKAAKKSVGKSANKVSRKKGARTPGKKTARKTRRAANKK